MQNREEALVEIYNRCYADRVSLGIRTFRRTPTKPIDSYSLPVCFMHEGDDDLIQTSKRDALGYPAKRRLEVTLELIAEKSVNIKDMFTSLRKTVLLNPVVGVNAFINEIRTEGPTGYGLHDVHGIRLVLALTYIDDGS